MQWDRLIVLLPQTWSPLWHNALAYSFFDLRMPTTAEGRCSVEADFCATLSMRDSAFGLLRFAPTPRLPKLQASLQSRSVRKSPVNRIRFTPSQGLMEGCVAFSPDDFVIFVKSSASAMSPANLSTFWASRTTLWARLTTPRACPTTLWPRPTARWARPTTLSLSRTTLRPRPTTPRAVLTTICPCPTTQRLRPTTPRFVPTTRRALPTAGRAHFSIRCPQKHHINN